MTRIGARACPEPPFVVIAGVNDVELLRYVAGDVPRNVAVARPGDHYPAARVGDDRLELGRRQAPVQRHRDRADLACREQQLDDLRRGAVEVCNAVPGPHACREQRLSQAVRAVIKLGVGHRSRAASHRDDVRSTRRVLAHDVGHPKILENLH